MDKYQANYDSVFTGKKELDFSNPRELTDYIIKRIWPTDKKDLDTSYADMFKL